MYLSEDEYNDWLIEGVDDYVEFEADTLVFEPMPHKNLLGHTAEWRASLSDWQLQVLQGIADEDGAGLKIEWGVFMCPAWIDTDQRQLVINTGGVW